MKEDPGYPSLGSRLSLALIYFAPGSLLVLWAWHSSFLQIVVDPTRGWTSRLAAAVVPGIWMAFLALEGFRSFRPETRRPALQPQDEIPARRLHYAALVLIGVLSFLIFEVGFDPKTPALAKLLLLVSYGLVFTVDFVEPLVIIRRFGNGSVVSGQEKSEVQ